MDLLSTYASLSVNDLALARQFYEEKLGLEVVLDAAPNLLMIAAADTRFMIYQKNDHQPSTHTVLNFAVENIEGAVRDLKSKGVVFDADEAASKNGIVVQGPLKMAWFKDAAGNSLALSEGL